MSATETKALVERLREQLKVVHGIIVEASETGFNYKTGDWATRLYESQWETSQALKAAALPQRDAMREALRAFVSCAYPVATEINPRGHNWRGEESLDWALSEARAALAEEPGHGA